MNLLYIDPGTGSALFSIVLGLLTTVYFVGRALIIKFKFKLTGKKVDVSLDEQKYIVFCEGPQYLSVFLPVLEAFEKRKTELTYLTSVKDDPAFSANYEYIKTEYIGEGNTAIARLNFLKAAFCLMTTPGLNVYQLKRSKGVKHYSHVLHMASDATMYRMFGLDYFDSVLLSGDFQKKDIQLLEEMRNINQKELVTVGCPYLDVLKQRYESVKVDCIKDKKDFTVLISPSWGQNALLTRYGTKLLDPLVKTGYQIIIRPHPQSKTSEKDMLDTLTETYKDCENVVWDFEKDNIYSIAKSDIMISDFSGIIFDYTFLHDKPFLYVHQDFDLRPYDADDLADNEPSIQPWQFEVLSTIGKKLDENDFENLETILKSMSDSEELAKARKMARETAWMHEGQAGEKIADYMIAKVESLTE